MIIEMLSYVCESANPVVFHWSQAELVILKSLNSKNGNILQPYLDDIKFVDLYKVFLDGPGNTGLPIIIPGALSFGLKDIATAMYNNRLIQTKWECGNSVSNGIEALFAGVALFDTSDYSPKDKKTILSDIAKYNEVDCKVLMEIYKWLLATYPSIKFT